MSLRRDRFSPEWWEAWTEVDANGCRNWKGSKCREGRGRTWYKGKGGVLIHRIAYECFRGQFDQALKVCHSCDNPSCVNPYHLFLGTQKENLRDMFAKGRARPRGKTVRRRKAPLVTVPLLSQNPHASVATIDIVHLIGTILPPCDPGEVTPVWCRVTGVPAKRPTRAIVLWRRPTKWTPETASATDFDVEGRDAGGMLQLAISGSCVPLSASPRRANGAGR